SAIGAACCEMMSSLRCYELKWDVFAGPALLNSEIPQTWVGMSCNVSQLAELLHRRNEPVVMLNGRAELGPRALGNRSIIGPAVDARMKTTLNEIKERQWYRPVAPICIEEDAPEVFEPGTPDRYMLFEHRIREQWLNRIPAVTHLDGTARLQT